MWSDLLSRRGASGYTDDELFAGAERQITRTVAPAVARRGLSQVCTPSQKCVWPHGVSRTLPMGKSQTFYQPSPSNITRRDASISGEWVPM